jgi:hypothetical protein
MLAIVIPLTLAPERVVFPNARMIRIEGHERPEPFHLEYGSVIFLEYVILSV